MNTPLSAGDPPPSKRGPVVMVSGAVSELFGQILVGRLVGARVGEAENLLDFVAVKNVGAQQTIGWAIVAKQKRLEPGFAMPIVSFRDCWLVPGQ